MREETWNTVFNAMKIISILFIIAYYLFPDMFVLYDKTTGRMSTTALVIIIYVCLFIILLAVRYFTYKKTHATVNGTWSITPDKNTSEITLDGKTSKEGGLVNLFSDSDAKTFLAEVFTFSFFVSIDKSSIELMRGEDLKHKNGMYQKLIVVPGAFTINIDPIYEKMEVVFNSYGTNPYIIEVPTLSVQRWHQIAISIEGRIADIYQNGILVKSVPLPNVINKSPGNPYVIMNSNMYAKINLVKAWPFRLLEKDLIQEYRIDTDAQGTPTFPEITNILKIPKFDFCLGNACFSPSVTKETALTTVEYTYA
jgi:hypothetical protein